MVFCICSILWRRGVCGYRSTIFFAHWQMTGRNESIGVILSGMGSDGTLGLRAIREKAGLCLVQEPTSAGFDGMPRSAIDAGLADIIAPAEEMPGKILAFLRSPCLVPQSDALPEDTNLREPGKNLHSVAHEDRV